jgi:hypothetical protein
MQITQSSDITPATITGILVANGVLSAGVVTAVTCTIQSSQKGFFSDVAAFELSYSQDAPVNAPH